MKKLVLTLTVSLACVAAFAQGKIQFANDSLHVVYMTANTANLLSGDVAAAGLAAPTSITANLAVDLYAGTSSDALSKIGTAAFGLIPGRWTSVNLATAPTQGTACYFQVQVYHKTAGSEAAAAAGSMLYYGVSDIFTAVPNAGTSGSYPSLVTVASQSTWAAGSYQIPGSSNLGAIALQANVPEPTSLALLGLGAAGMLIFRRRK